MGAYKIKDLEILSGIKAHTIRIWEKRYGILTPKRTDTHIRTYSDRELTLLLNISLLNKAGIKISRIAEMSEDEIFRRFREEVENTEATFHQNLLISLLNIDENLFLITVDTLIHEIGFENTFAEHLIPFLDKIGVMWIVGTINPAQEHFISNLIRQKIIAETDKISVECKGKRVLLFLPEHETHEIGLLFYNYKLRNEGISTIYLGQQLPYDSVLQCLEKVNPDCLITSWIANTEEEFILTYFENLRKLIKIPIFVGGFQMCNFGDKLSKNVQLIRNASDVDKVIEILSSPVQ
jgi:DNA-binding transcriptional MerR regulator